MGVVSRWMWVESMGVASGCGCKEDFLILLIPTPLVSVLFCLLLCHAAAKKNRYKRSRNK